MFDSDDMKREALAACRARFSVVPKRRGAKRPAGQWQQFQSRRAGEEEVGAAFVEPQEGWGVILGPVSEHAEMLELEGRAVDAGLLELLSDALVAAGYPELLDRIAGSYCDETPSGGIHLIYRCATVAGNTILARRADGEVMIETRGSGGFVVCAPSSGHPTGRTWSRRSGSFSTVATITPAERDALFAAARSLDETPPGEAPPASPGVVCARADRGVRPGDHFNERADWMADVLAPHGWTYSHTSRGVLYVTRPGKDPREGHSATIGGTPAGDRLCVFSASTPFRCSPASYTKFEAWALLNCDGDLSAAAKELAERGYATPSRDPGSDHSEILDDDFWQSRPYLAHISEAAHAQLVSRTAVLHVVLARVAAVIPHTIKLPAIVGTSVPLSYFAAVIAPPGGGKSAAVGVATELLPTPDGLDINHQLPIGSGEGLVEALFGLVDEEDGSGKTRKVKRQVRHNAFVYVDEGEMLHNLASRAGSTLGPTIRTIFTGGVLGNTNASDERKRIVPAGQYTYGVVCGFQDVLAGALLDDADGGTPQRFAWASATDPTIPDRDDGPGWPGPLDWRPPDQRQLFPNETFVAGYVRHFLTVDPEIRAEIRRAHRAKIAGIVRIDELDAHRTLMQLKIAGLLALLDQRSDVSEDDWKLADLILADSDRTRAQVIETVRAHGERREAETSQRLARRHVDAMVAVEAGRVDVAARKIATRVWADGPVRRRILLQDMRRYRDVFNVALDRAAAVGWIAVTSEPGRGTQKRVIRPGGTRP